MVTMIILGALNMLGEALATEFMKQATSKASETLSTISNLEVRMKNLSRELRVMEAFLEQIDMRDQSNRTLEVWLLEVQDVANQIEKIMEEFMYLVSNQKFGGMGFYIKKIFKEPKSLSALKQIVTQLEGAENSILHLEKLKDRWFITNESLTAASTSNAIDDAAQVAMSSHFIDRENIVGVGIERANLVRLIQSKNPLNTIISVWGMAGVGKTTLVTDVFKREKNNFPCHAWISISQNYQVDHILRKLIFEIDDNSHSSQIDTNNMDTKSLKETIRRRLQQNKYLIVLDDAWDFNFIQDLRDDVFVECEQGSRIIITTRSAELASLSRERNKLELKPLSYNKSWNLFCRKAFQFDQNYECPLHLVKWANKIVHKCDGLPLALVTLGSVLSTHGQTEDEWKRVYNQLSSELGNNKRFDRLTGILKLSFDYLPTKELKNCFLYCCMFPEDDLISRKKLIRLWIAEGFVQQVGDCTLEETAEGYLSELITHSMLQVVMKNCFGRVQRCRVHDTLRELGISLCMKENFCLVYGKNKLVKKDKSYIRLSIIKYDNSIDHHRDLAKLRTLMSFDLTMQSSQLITTRLLECKHLAVLNLEDLGIEGVPDNIGKLFNLRYLGMRNTKVKLLPNSISELRNLQTLDLYKCEIKSLPNGIVQLTQLRHLFAEDEIDRTGKSVRTFTGIKIPKEMCYLKEIQTLRAVESDDTIVTELGNLIQLKSFKIYNVDDHHSIELCKSLSKLRFLSNLSICVKSEYDTLELGGLELPNIQKLTLRGKLSESMHQYPFFQNLGASMQTLRLGWSKLKNDPLNSFSHLGNLTFLDLNRAYDGPELIFKAGWFLKLKFLTLSQMPNLVNVEMEQGTMLSLEQIELWVLKKLVVVPGGMDHLISLKLMFCSDMHSGFGGLANGTHKLFHFTCIIQ